MKSTKKQKKQIKPYREAIIKKRYNVLLILVIVAFLVLIIKLFYVQILSTDEYKLKLDKLTNIKVYGATAPRGRIYDRFKL